MNYKCPKCNKIFSNSYNYSRHISKKIPCDTIFKCDNCGKISPNDYSLNKHLNKKIPCERKASIKSNVEILLEITKLKLEDKEKERQFKKEIIELKTRAALEKITLAEKLKTERKEKTVTHINNVHIENSLQANIQNNLKIEQTFYTKRYKFLWRKS
ncbi:MAG: C2H2-type zinc finger protein [Cetobacterium sp.]